MTKNNILATIQESGLKDLNKAYFTPDNRTFSVTMIDFEYGYVEILTPSRIRMQLHDVHLEFKRERNNDVDNQ